MRDSPPVPGGWDTWSSSGGPTVHKRLIVNIKERTHGLSQKRAHWRAVVNRYMISKTAVREFLCCGELNLQIWKLSKTSTIVWCQSCRLPDAAQKPPWIWNTYYGPFQLTLWHKSCFVFNHPTPLPSTVKKANPNRQKAALSPSFSFRK